MIPSIRKPRAGLLLLSPERFASVGEGTARGSYRERKEAEAAWMVRDCAAHFDVTFPGIVWNTRDVKRAIDAFTAEKVDFVLAGAVSLLGGGLRLDTFPAGHAAGAGALCPPHAGGNQPQGHP